MQVRPFRRYSRIEAARLVVYQANKLVQNARYNITKDPVDETDRNRGVGDYAVWFECDDCRVLSVNEHLKADAILDKAEARAATAELCRLAVNHPIAQTWWLNPDNVQARHLF